MFIAMNNFKVAPGKGGDPLRKLDQLARAGQPDTGALQTPAAFDEHRVGGVDQDVRHFRVIDQRLQRPDAADLGLDLGHQHRAGRQVDLRVLELWQKGEIATFLKMLPGMTVIVPCDFNQTKAATIAIADYVGPVYLRFGRPKWPNFTDPNEAFEIGKAQVLAEGFDISIFACGHLVWKAIEAARILEEQGISVEVINIHTIKPLDKHAVIESITKTKCAVTAEEHNVLGGLGDSIAQLAARHHPVPIEYVGTNDTFGESGTPDQLLKKYGLDTPNIVEAAQKVLARKKNIKLAV